MNLRLVLIAVPLATLTCVLPHSLALAAEASHSKLAVSDWSVNASPNLATNPPGMKVLVEFLNEVLSSTGEDADIGQSELDEEHASYVCSFQFANLRHNGSLSLVAGFGVPERPSCRDVYIIDKVPNGFEVYATGGPVGEGGDVSAGLQDLGKDGHLEFLYEDSLASGGARCRAGWTVVYAWTGDGYKNVSDKFKDFYQQRLNDIGKELATPQPAGSSEDDSKPCLEIEAKRIRQFLGVSSNQGLNAAVESAESSDPAKRELAAYQLGAIGTPEAGKHLETLARDPDAGVAFMGKYYLARLMRGPPQPPKELQRVAP